MPGLCSAALFFSLLAPPGELEAAPRLEKPAAIVTPEAASPLENLAAREVRRYWYLRTGRLLPLVTGSNALPRESGLVVVARKDRPLVAALSADPAVKSAITRLHDQEYVLKTIFPKTGQADLLIGGDGAGTLYAAYRFAEELGVRFFLHGDVVPDERANLRLPLLNEDGKPLFALRGIQPFHDFPEGPDWWNLDDYRAILSQIAKLRMNFFGLHTYPEGRPNAEPTVWIGLPEDLGAKGRVKFSYPASYQNTLRGNWGYATRKTSDYFCGAAELFELDGFGSEVMLGFCPQPARPEACNEVFELTGALLGKAFQHARNLGIKTCLGTETPLVVPKLVADRLKAAGKNPKDPEIIRALYEGMFRRAAAVCDLDYYWFWTPEDWTWKNVKPEQVERTTNDLAAAIAAAEAVQPPFKLATCGWVLGPTTDRALFDKVLPKEIAVSCINREVGKTPVDAAFAEVEGRRKWAIPWLEDDPGLTSPQLWAGRMRRDAFDARRYGCDGLMGIHWRTRVLGPAVSALAQAAWEQGEWSKKLAKSLEVPRVAGPVGGESAAVTNRIEDAENEPLYQTVRYKVAAYRLPCSNGVCSVTMKFCEPSYTNAGQRVFDVKLQGKRVLQNLDIYAKVGKNRPLDYTYDDIEVTNGWVDIDFMTRVEEPSIAAISIRNGSFRLNINCGGPAWQDYLADLPGVPKPKPLFAATTDFYQDWAVHEFGPEAGPYAARIFEKIDGELPRPSDWVEGPGGLKPDKRPWAKVQGEYAFVYQLAALAPKVTGRGNQERFQYWVHTLQYMRSLALVNCLWFEYNEAIKKVKAAKPELQKELARKTALPLRVALARAAGQVYEHLLATISNPGELGTLANWEQHLLPGLLHKPGQELAKILGEDLPPEAQLPKSYRGPPRLIVPTARTSYTRGDDFRLKLLILSEEPPVDAALFWRLLGRGKYSKVPALHVARGVYSVQMPMEATASEDLEYYVKVVPARGKALYFPATAPAINQTLVAQ